MVITDNTSSVLFHSSVRFYNNISVSVDLMMRGVIKQKRRNNRATVYIFRVILFQTGDVASHIK